MCVIYGSGMAAFGTSNCISLKYCTLTLIYSAALCTVEPPIVDTLKSGQPPYNGQTACPLPTTVCMLEPPKKGQPPNNGQNTRPQRLHCSEVPLYNIQTISMTDWLCVFLHVDVCIYGIRCFRGSCISCLDTSAVSMMWTSIQRNQSVSTIHKFKNPFQYLSAI